MSALARKRLIGLFLAMLVFVADQWTKFHIVETIRLMHTGPIEVLPFFDLTFVRNTGVSLGIFAADSVEVKYALILVTGAIALFVFGWMLREKAMAEIAALALVLGGAAGNIRDRFSYGYVVDFIDIHFGGWTPFVFNIADAAITIGVLIILARSLLSREKPEAEAETAPKGLNP